jgi:pimeloyl-ACP methyl ester carboxylesterase
MKKIFILSWPIVLLCFFYGCSPKEKTAAFIDYETITKDAAFRDGIKKGNFIKLSNGYTYYEYGNKDADTLLVMVHGFSVPSYVWDSTYSAALKRGYGALRYDTYGRGYSDNPDVDYNVALYSQQLKELLDTLQINAPIYLLGLSDGGRTISAFASQHPERVKSLVYVDPTGFNTITDSLSQSTAVSDEEIQSFKRNRYPTMASGQLGDFYDSVPFKGWDNQYRQLMQFKGFVRALISTNKNRTNLEKEHRQIAASGMPVFAIWGEHDTVVKLEDVRPNLMDRIPTIKLSVIPNAGHLPHMEQTALFNSILFDQIILGKALLANAIND